MGAVSSKILLQVTIYVSSRSVIACVNFRHRLNIFAGLHDPKLASFPHMGTCNIYGTN